MDRLASFERAVVMLDVGGVLGEHVGPRTPVARASGLLRDLEVVVVRALQLVARSTFP